MVERKALCANPRHQYHVSNQQNMIVVPITKRMEIILSVQVSLISWMNFIYEENGGKKAFLPIPKHQHHVSRCVEHGCSANKKKIRDYYEHPGSSHFLHEL